jgi:hypothetical protein
MALLLALASLFSTHQLFAMGIFEWPCDLDPAFPERRLRAGALAIDAALV